MLIGELEAAIKRRVVMPEGMAAVVAHWVLFAHTHDAHIVSPILAILAPERECGKSTLLDTISWLVPRPLPSSGTSPAVVYRVIDAFAPTMLTDEMETLPKEALEVIRGIYDAGHTRRFARILRMDGDPMEVHSFSTWAPKAIAQIGKPAETILSRSIVVELSRKASSQRVEKLSPEGAPDIHALARKCVRWAIDNVTELSASPSIPEAMGNRLGDNWTPLFSIADQAGGKWPDAIRKMGKASRGNEDEVSIGVEALIDIKAIFEANNATKLGSDFICSELHKLEHRPCPEYGRSRKPISKVQLANILKRYRIAPGTVRPDPEGVSGKDVKGYKLADFDNAFFSYLPSQGGTTSQVNETAAYSPNQGVTNESVVTP